MWATDQLKHGQVQKASERPSAKVAAWGSAIGESLIAGDLAALIAHRRANALQHNKLPQPRSASRGTPGSDTQTPKRSENAFPHWPSIPFTRQLGTPTQRRDQQPNQSALMFEWKGSRAREGCSAGHIF